MLAPKIIQPKDFLKTQYQASAINEAEFLEFKDNILNFTRSVKPNESEEFLKGDIKTFLQSVLYSKYYINTKKHIGGSGVDLVIYEGNSASSEAAVLIEVKAVGASKKDAMMSMDNLNVKSFHELLLYYMREKFILNNIYIKHLIVTNGFEWFIFNAEDFDKIIDQKLKKDFYEWQKREGLPNDVFYENIAKPFVLRQTETPRDLLDAIDTNRKLVCAYFNLQDSKCLAVNSLRYIYKLLHPNCLLQNFNANDANMLNKPFYYELLHILGLEEKKEGGKKVIVAIHDNNHDGYWVHNCLMHLKQDERKLLEFPSKLGDVHSEGGLYSIAVELVMTWINRILFLKLLESQLVKYNNDASFKFLYNSKIADFDELDALFFEVLAKRPHERLSSMRDKFSTIPYLNSSLFEISELESHSIRVNSLFKDASVPYYKGTILKDANGNKLSGTTKPLEYLFSFLDAYSFTRTKDGISSDKLINASVLGLIFEKINGYKDGSFYTPGFITTYMSKESLKQTVLEKFKVTLDTQATSLTELSDELHVLARKDKSILSSASSIVDSITICDPAVGSGHFLVSCLNELLAIKSELGLLFDEDGRPLRCRLSTENDELVVRNSDEEVFEYTKTKTKNDVYKIQKAIFEEKREIIENQLFGVDLNQNSVNICRLRLWIELLKEAYYTEESNFLELETLPNIDINIKWGNSLISRFKIEDKFEHKNGLETFKTYRQLVSDYKNSANKSIKSSIQKEIDGIIETFSSALHEQSPEVLKLKGLLKSYIDKYCFYEISEEIIADYATAIQTSQFSRFGRDFSNRLDGERPSTKGFQKELSIIENLYKEISEMADGKIYKNAFEWRFWFPEVLDEKGDFVGFDVVIGNPPYVFARENFSPQEKSFFISHYKLSAYQLNLYILFLEKSSSILKKGGQLSFIVPNNWLTINSAKTVRDFILSYSDITVVNFTAKVFDEANVDTAIVMYKKDTCNPIINLYESSGIEGMHLVKTTPVSFFTSKTDAIINIEAFKNTDVYGLIDKIEAKAIMLNKVADVKVGLKAYQTGKGKPLQTDAMKKSRIYHAKEPLDESYFTYLDGKDVSRYALGWSGEFLKYGVHLAEPRKFKLFSTPRILVRQIPSKPPYCIHACYTDSIMLNDLNSMNIVNITKHPLFILALLNSRLLSFWFVHKFGKLSRGIFPQFKINELEQFPIALTDDETPFIDLADKIITCKVQNPKTDTSELEAQIDKIVYQLYDLSEKEIKIIQGHSEEKAGLPMPLLELTHD